MDDRARNEEMSLLAGSPTNNASSSAGRHDISSESTAPPTSSRSASDDLADHTEQRLNGKQVQPTAPESNSANSTAIVSNDAGTHIVTLPATDANTTAVPILVSATEVYEAPSSVDSSTGVNLGKKKPRSLLEIFIPWKIEIIAAVFALALLICEIAILAHYDGKFLFEHWPHGWKINAVFAFLTTFLEAAVAFYVGACIGQLRWYWFKKKQHRLDWLEIMTEARQPPGAMQLIFRRGMQK